MPSAKVSNKFEVEEESCKMSCCCKWLFVDVILSPRIYSSIFCQRATPQRNKNSIQTPKIMLSTNTSNKYEMRRVNLNKLVALSCVKAQYSNWQQMTLTISCQAQKWATNLGWKRSLARCLAAANDFLLMWSCYQECITVCPNKSNGPLLNMERGERDNGKFETSEIK